MMHRPDWAGLRENDINNNKQNKDRNENLPVLNFSMQPERKI
jgi:hypothetical protein